MKREGVLEGKRWFKQALRDIDDAKFACGGRRFNLVCFLAQQAAEKALKAYLYAQGVEIVWGHSVVELCVDVESFDESFSRWRKAGGILDRYYIPTRYPNGLPGSIPADVYQEEDAQEAVILAEGIIEAVREKKFAENTDSNRW